MSKYQQQYNKAKEKIIREEIPKIDKEIRELRTARSALTNVDMKKATDAKIKALEIKKKSYRTGDPVKEEAGVSTGSIGSPTMSTNDGGTAPAVWGSSHIYADKIGDGKVASRKGPVGKGKKKKKKKVRNEFVEHYFEVKE